MDLYFKYIVAEGFTFPYKCPYMLKELINRIRGGLDMSKIKTSMTGGEVIKKELLRELCELGYPMLNAYGGTEIGEICGTVLTDPIDIKIEKTGQCLDNEVKVIDEDGVIVPIGTEGEVCARNTFMFAEYLGDEERIKGAKDSKGWYHTDDIGVMDENGYLTIRSRKSEVISTATVKIYPSAIEKIMRQHPKIHEVVASGIPHPIIKEEICLSIIEEPGTGLTLEEVGTYCKEMFQADEIGSPSSRPDMSYF
jgi:fatty-acyl-CoA synthase